jgi:hypothetical protein
MLAVKATSTATHAGLALMTGDDECELHSCITHPCPRGRDLIEAWTISRKNVQQGGRFKREVNKKERLRPEADASHYAISALAAGEKKKKEVTLSTAHRSMGSFCAATGVLDAWIALASYFTPVIHNETTCSSQLGCCSFSIRSRMEPARLRRESGRPDARHESHPVRD